MLLRLSLSVAPCFLWECLTSRTVSWFPAPAASNPSCRFPAMGLPAGFRSRVMRPTRLAGLSVMTRVVNDSALNAPGRECYWHISRKAPCGLVLRPLRDSTFLEFESPKPFSITLEHAN